VGGGHDEGIAADGPVVGDGAGGLAVDGGYGHLGDPAAGVVGGAGPRVDVVAGGCDAASVVVDGLGRAAGLWANAVWVGLGLEFEHAGLLERLAGVAGVDLGFGSAVVGVAGGRAAGERLGNLPEIGAGGP